MRVLLTWELGLNLGHLTRLLPVAQQLKADGHVVLVAVRDIRAAATVLGPAAIPFVQAPHLPQGIPLAHRATGYADILLSQGWSDRLALWGLTQGWLNIFQLFRPDKLILDYSPTVSLAARIAEIPTVLVGNGFELPPLTDPLPAFPGLSWALPEKAAESEKLAVFNANGVLRAFRRPSIAAHRDLVIDQFRLFATFPELDHYGEREDAEYIGPLHGKLNTPTVGWPEGGGPKVFACLRPDTSHVNEILTALLAINSRVVCVASGFTRQHLEQFKRNHVRFAPGQINLEPLFDADLCITYGAEGTATRFLMAGVPQLISPWHVETYMAVRRIEVAGLGRAVRSASDASAECILRIANNTTLRQRAKIFALRNAEINRGNAGTRLRDILNQGDKRKSSTKESAPSTFATKTAEVA
jgi:UDP:flavonoid glycosyltransferase YjiC (YdhE family)